MISQLIMFSNTIFITFIYVSYSASTCFFLLLPHHIFHIFLLSVLIKLSCIIRFKGTYEQMETKMSPLTTIMYSIRNSDYVSFLCSVFIIFHLLYYLPTIIFLLSIIIPVCVSVCINYYESPDDL